MRWHFGHGGVRASGLMTRSSELIDLGLHRAHALDVDLAFAFEGGDSVEAPLQRYLQIGDLEVGRRARLSCGARWPSRRWPL
jgi:hypothetical protein